MATTSYHRFTNCYRSSVSHLANPNHADRTLCGQHFTYTVTSRGTVRNTLLTRDPNHVRLCRRCMAAVASHN